MEMKEYTFNVVGHIQATYLAEKQREEQQSNSFTDVNLIRVMQ